MFFLATTYWNLTLPFLMTCLHPFKFKPLSKLDQERYHYSHFNAPTAQHQRRCVCEGNRKPVRMLSLNGVSAHDIVQRHDCVERFLNWKHRPCHAWSTEIPPLMGSHSPCFIQIPGPTPHAPVNPSEVLSMVTTLFSIKSNKG
jgi:hypothetical protein